MVDVSADEASAGVGVSIEQHFGEQVVEGQTLTTEQSAVDSLAIRCLWAPEVCVAARHGGLPPAEAELRA